MFDIGLGEIIILAVLGLLVFGPERLPKAAADAAKMMRNVRAMAGNARKDLTDAAGVDLSDAKDAFRDISSLHPKNLMAGVFDDTDDDAGPSAAPAAAPKPDQPARFDPDAT